MLKNISSKTAAVQEWRNTVRLKRRGTLPPYPCRFISALNFIEHPKLRWLKTSVSLGHSEDIPACFHLPLRLPRTDPFVLRLLVPVSFVPMLLPPTTHPNFLHLAVKVCLALEGLLVSSVLEAVVCWITSSRQNILTTDMMWSFLGSAGSTGFFFHSFPQRQ